jgi:hypothetical protein
MLKLTHHRMDKAFGVKSKTVTKADMEQLRTLGTRPKAKNWLEGGTRTVLS